MHETDGEINEPDDELHEQEIIYENDPKKITTDEILEMYENVVDFNDIDHDNKITTEEILKMYESESDSGEGDIYCVQTTSRKKKKIITHKK